MAVLHPQAYSQVDRGIQGGLRGRLFVVAMNIRTKSLLASVNERSKECLCVETCVMGNLCHLIICQSIKSLPLNLVLVAIFRQFGYKGQVNK